MNRIIPRNLRNLAQYQQTYWLIAGAISGYIGFVLILGTTPLVIGIGGAIALAMIAVWFRTVNQALAKSTHNLLEREIFLAHLNKCQRQIDKSSQTTWQQSYQWAKATQQFAQQIAQLEPTLIPELIEALHTVLDLTQQVVSALATTHQVQSSKYHFLAKQQLQISCDRLENTHNQLQHLHDQFLLSRVNQNHNELNLPKTLQVIITENKTAIN
ncbi:hypothetical protein [Nostoc sp. MS1]|uniref:hypothetical protein n=1 Tax=Nostoc sp. MS1 TaxID=2764711 RepID=UPI001CC37D9C|nr:hypothetical protein [Nostoc sp. MS1]BCL38416.1 hypothetical protein NSMS1_48630 [Nostoc sp. MS1]